MESLLNFFTFCNAIELSNVLASGTYFYPPESIVAGISPEDAHANWDGNALDLKVRQLMAQARGVKEELESWFFSNYDLVHSDSSVLDGRSAVYERMLAWHLCCMRRTMGKLEDDDLAGGTLDGEEQRKKFDTQMQWVEKYNGLLPGVVDFSEDLPLRMHVDEEILGFTFTVRRKPVATLYTRSCFFFLPVYQPYAKSVPTASGDRRAIFKRGMRRGDIR